MVPLQPIGGFEMKKFMMLTAVLTAVLTLAGCCTKNCPAKGESCPKQKKCDMPCAKKSKKCPFVGKWNFFVEQEGKLVALPLDPAPQLELCPKGVMRFHYTRDGKAAILEGRWCVRKGALVISNVSGSNVQSYVLQADKSAVYTVGKNDKLPENTKVVIKKAQ